VVARRSVWSNPEVQKLLAEFVPSADEVTSLQNRKDPEAKLFQKVAEQGHYAGRTQPTNTRQGTYATAPSGVLLASINSNNPQAMADMLKRALEKWNSLPDSEKWLEGELNAEAAKGRPEDFYPSDGLVLRQTTRDLPRESLPADWRGQAWNKDYLWFSKLEAESLVPLPEIGATSSVPKPTMLRIARLALKDTVRGQSYGYRPESIQVAELTTKVVSKKGALLELQLEGKAKAEETGNWPISGYRDMNAPTAQKRGYDLVLSGKATWDSSKQKFTKFDLVASGTRWGATQYNGRHDDLGPAPIGFLFELASDKPYDRVPPSDFWAYGWRR
jgi:hypothetical protein